MAGIEMRVSDPQVVIVATIKSRGDEIIRWIEKNSQLTGIQRFNLFLEDPESVAPVESFAASSSELSITVVEACYEHYSELDEPSRRFTRYRQIFNLAMARSLYEGDAWLIHIDVDEIILPQTDVNLAAYIAKVAAQGFDELRFEIAEFAPDFQQHLQFAEFPDVVRCRINPLPSRIRRVVAQILLLGRHPFLGNNHFRGHKSSKYAFRNSCPARATIHRLESENGPAVRSYRTKDYWLLHFDIFNVDHLRCKLADKIRDREDGLKRSSQRERTLESFERSVLFGSISSFYLRYYCLSKAAYWILASLNLAKTFDLSRVAVGVRAAGKN